MYIIYGETLSMFYIGRGPPCESQGGNKGKSCWKKYICINCAVAQPAALCVDLKRNKKKGRMKENKKRRGTKREARAASREP